MFHWRMCIVDQLTIGFERQQRRGAARLLALADSGLEPSFKDDIAMGKGAECADANPGLQKDVQVPP
jgi:hypothetical protein